MKRRIDPILEETANLLDYPPEVIGDVVNHAFKFLKEYIKSPESAGIRYPHFGVIRPSLKALNHNIQSEIIPRLRKFPDSNL